MLKNRLNTWLVVEGAGQFPLDMLRYDSCFPRTETDAAKAQNEHIRRRVMLQISPGTSPQRYGPTVGRWDSFRWRVVAFGTDSDIANGLYERDYPTSASPVVK